MKKLLIAIIVTGSFAGIWGMDHHANAKVKAIQDDIKIVEARLNEVKAGQAKVRENITNVQNKKPSAVQNGKASWYDYTLKDGWSSKGHLVCASRDFPRKSVLKVYSNGKSTTCLVTDYGPDAKVHPDRIVDLSSSAFSKLAPISKGVIDVQVVRIK